MENGYEIWYMECQEPLQGRFIENGSKGVREVHVRLSGFTGGQMGGRHLRVRGIYVYFSIQKGMKIIS
jgi:hypothetical protein